MNIAEQILKSMDYMPPTFDTKTFLNLIVSYFRAGKPHSVLRVQRRRVYGLEPDNKTGFIDLIDDDKRFQVYLRCIDKRIEGSPLILVDETYYTNAVALLSWQGFRVEKIDKITTRVSLI